MPNNISNISRGRIRPQDVVKNRKQDQNINSYQHALLHGVLNKPQQSTAERALIDPHTQSSQDIPNTGGSEPREQLVQNPLINPHEESKEEEIKEEESKQGQGFYQTSVPHRQLLSTSPLSVPHHQEAPKNLFPGHQDLFKKFLLSPESTNSMYDNLNKVLIINNGKYAPKKNHKFINPLTTAFNDKYRSQNGGMSDVVKMRLGGRDYYLKRRKTNNRSNNGEDGVDKWNSFYDPKNIRKLYGDIFDNENYYGAFRAVEPTSKHVFTVYPGIESDNTVSKNKHYNGSPYVAWEDTTEFLKRRKFAHPDPQSNNYIARKNRLLPIDFSPVSTRNPNSGPTDYPRFRTPSNGRAPIFNQQPSAADIRINVRRRGRENARGIGQARGNVRGQTPVSNVRRGKQLPALNLGGRGRAVERGGTNARGRGVSRHK